MKILNVIMCLDPVKGGGSVERTLQISRALVQEGHQCTILTTDVGLSDEHLADYRKEGVDIVVLPTLWRRFYFPKLSPKIIDGLVADADVVQLVNHWTVINVLAYSAIRRLKKHYAVCPAGSLSIYGRSIALKKIYNLLIGHEIVKRADGHIAIAPNEISHYASYDIHPEQISVIPNGTNPQDFPESNGHKFRFKLGIGASPLILFLGRLHPIKGPDLLLEAFCRCVGDGMLNGYHLAFAGPDDGMLGLLRSRAIQSGLEKRIHFAGHVRGAEKADAYRAANFLVIPSRQEAMSIVVLEAGISALPVLITDQCGFDDVETVNGGLVVPASHTGLYSGLCKMEDRFNTLKEMGKNLERYTRSNFLWRSIVGKHLKLFRAMVESPKS